MNIVVAGAGTAGWLAALFAKRTYPKACVTVVHDDKTPIIGVGEGTTPNFVSFLEMIDISTEELIQNCEATIKNGIKFTNWTGDGTHYHHSFNHPAGEVVKAALCKGVNLDKVLLNYRLSECNKIPLDDIATCFNSKNSAPYALHFNAKKLADFFESVATRRGVKTIIGKITDVIRDNNDYVRQIVLDTKQQIKTDFVFDCTGFARLFVDKIYKSPFRSYEKSLPAKRAMPFFLDMSDTTPPFTEAIAMKYGWMWKIPVGNRYGCGYVFDSNYITDEQAYEEICEITKQKPHVPKKISFKPGYYTKPFNKNTLAIGLSHGFLEPLEATSLSLVISMLLALPPIGMYNDHIIQRYNEITTRRIENMVDMLYIHYLTPREDTDFWKNFKTNNETPEHTTRTLEQLKIDDCNQSPFTTENFLTIINGVNGINDEFIKNFKYMLNDIDLEDRIKGIENLCDTASTHDRYLNLWSNNSMTPQS